MPRPDDIVQGLGVIAREWAALALIWHVYFALFWCAILGGWRPPQPTVAALQLPPLVSVSILAWLGGNPFNGSIFGVLALMLAGICMKLPAQPVSFSASQWIAAGSTLAAFAWIYPHFLNERPPYSYLYEAPLGVIPCPTLSMVVATTLLLKGLGSRAWSVAIGAAGAFYGAFGALRLGVTIDWLLAAGAAGVLIQPAAKQRGP